MLNINAVREMAKLGEELKTACEAFYNAKDKATCTEEMLHIYMIKEAIMKKTFFD